MFFMAAVYAALVFLSILSSVACYDTKGKIVPNKLNVHLVPHTHDDVGWLRTVQEYYEGSVRSILTSVINNLEANPDRKFIWVEQAFFQMWWSEQKDAVKTTVKHLVESGQLDFVNGGWCMHDEATTHYVDMIEQMTLGHSFVKQQFGKVPRIAWQIDPFGHSAVQGYLLGAEMGFDGIFFARIDYQEKMQRSANKSLEVIWQGSKTLQSGAQIFADAFPYHYNPPKGFKYFGTSDDIILEDDPSKGTVNVKERVDAFVAAAHDYSTKTRTNHTMFFMGDDFTYQSQDASTWFTEMDKLIHYVNKDGRINVLYSTPSIYLDAKFAANEVWNVKTGDYFPYADSSTSYWTGYYTSRPALKAYTRQMSNYLQTARQLELLAGKQRTGPKTHYNLWQAISVLQHHDGVSGTEQQHVASDYAKRLSSAGAEAGEMMNLAISCLSQDGQVCHSAYLQCPLLNISYCAASEAAVTNNKPLVVTVYNSLGWTREEYVQIPVSSENVAVTDAAGNLVPSQLTPLSDSTMRLRNLYVKANLGEHPGAGSRKNLVFKVKVPPVGFSSYTVKPFTGKGSAVPSIISKPKDKFNIGSITNYWFSTSAELIGVTRSKGSSNFTIHHKHGYYRGPSSSAQNTGAYISNPTEAATEVKSSGTFEVIAGPVYDAVRRQVSSWIHEEFRVFKDNEHAEVEFTIGPVPVSDNVGKEVVTTFTSGIRSGKVFYTDSNGRDFLRRVRDSRPDWELQPVQKLAGNYYPVNLGIYVKDETNNLSVLVDRAVGGTSLVDGELEIMLHRRLLVDDGRGVSEPLNEEVCVAGTCEGLTTRGVLYMNVQAPEAASSWRRRQGQKVYSPLQLFFGNEKSAVKSFSMLKEGYALPHNVALLTLQEWTDGALLLRLAHIFEAGEDKELSKTAKVDLRQLLWKWEIDAVSELSLSGNQARSDIKRIDWKVAIKNPAGTRGGPIDAKLLVVELFPMEIRTLELKATRSSER